MTNYCLRRAILKESSNPSVCAEPARVELYKELLKQAPERKGLARFSMMSGVILIVGAVLLVLAFSDPTGDLLKTSLSVVMGALSSIIGFFFGGRLSEEAIEKAKGKQGGSETGGGSPGGGSTAG